MSIVEATLSAGPCHSSCQTLSPPHPHPEGEDCSHVLRTAGQGAAASPGGAGAPTLGGRSQPAGAWHPHIGHQEQQVRG